MLFLGVCSLGEVGIDPLLASIPGAVIELRLMEWSGVIGVGR
jgi:hypothetical protein